MRKLFILLVAVFLFGSVNALQVQPNEITIEGEKGDFYMQTITLFNDYNMPVNVTITASNINCFLPVTTISLQPYSAYQIPIGFYLNESKKGFIIYQCETNFVYQPVEINVQKEEIKVVIYPEKPKAGDTIAIMLVNEDLINAHGFLLCTASGRVYQVVITDGIGLVKLNESEPAGVAILRIVGEDISPIYKTINITEGSVTQNYITISAPTKKQVGEKVTATVVYNGNPVSTSIEVIKPSGETMTLYTDSSGKVSFTVDEVGKWTLHVKKGSAEATASIDVSRKTITLDYYPEEPSIIDKITIYLPADDFSVFADGEELHVSGNKAYFNPNEAGDYTIVAYNSTAEGKLTIHVKNAVTIKAKNMKGYLTYPYTASKMENIIFELYDYNGNPLHGYALDVSGEGMNYRINAWSAVKFDKAGTYMISFSGNDEYAPASISITVEGREAGASWWWAVGAVVVIIVAVTGYKYRDKVVGLFKREFSGEIYKDKE